MKGKNRRVKKGKFKGKHAEKTNNKSYVIILPIIVVTFLGLFLLYTLFFNKKAEGLRETSKKYFSENEITKEIGTIKNDIKFNLTNAYHIRYPKFKYQNINNQVKEFIDDSIKKDIKKNIVSGINSIIHNKYVYDIVDYESYLAPDGIIGICFINSKVNNKGKVISENVYTINLSINENDILNDTYIFVGNYKDKLTMYIDNYLNSNEELKSKLKDNYKDIINKNNTYKYMLTKDSILIYFNSNDVLKNNKKTVKVSIPYSEIEEILNIDYNNIVKLKDIKSIKESFKENKKSMYIKRLSNIYKDSNKNSEIVATIEKGNKVRVLKSSENYSLIKFSKKEGYILNKHLSDDIVADANFIDTNETVYASEDVSVKKDTKDDAEELVKLALGDSITRIGTSDDGWSEVVYNNEKGYVKSNYLSLVKLSRNIKIDKNKNINAKSGMLALTFDDGPNPTSSGRILDTLEKYHVVATFFDLGKLALAYPDVVKREEALGCEVGSHSFDHPNLNNLSAEGIQAQITNSKNAFVSVLGHDVDLMRPPYGNANDLVKSIVPYPLINWNVDTLDWKSKNKDAIVNEVRKIGNLDGKIILMHSIYETTADAVEVIVPELINEGYQLVTVSELAYYKGVELSPGVKYFGF